MNSRPLRVAYILKMFPRLSETFILNEILELERQGVEVSVFSLMHPVDGRFHGRLAELNLTVETLARDKPEVYWQQLRNELADTAPSMESLGQVADLFQHWQVPKDLDLLLRSACIAATLKQRGIHHVHSHFATIATRVACAVNRLCDVPFSFTSHAKDIYRHTVNWSIYAELLEASRFNVTVCDYNLAHIRKQLPDALGHKVRRLYNGIDLEFFPQQARVQANGPLKILSVGRLVPKKGFDTLLHSLQRLQQLGVDFEANIIGSGELESGLLALQADLGLSEQVKFLGAQPQEVVRDLCGESDLIALACQPDPDGNQDALPTVLLEALAMDRPVVSTRVSGVPEIVGEQAGWVVEPANPDALAEAIRKAAQHVRTQDSMVGKPRDRAEQLFDLRVNVAQLHRWFESGGAERPS